MSELEKCIILAVGSGVIVFSHLCIYFIGKQSGYSDSEIDNRKPADKPKTHRVVTDGLTFKVQKRHVGCWPLKRKLWIDLLPYTGIDDAENALRICACQNAKDSARREWRPVECQQPKPVAQPDYEYSSVDEYEKSIDSVVDVSFKRGWIQARLTRKEASK